MHMIVRTSSAVIRGTPYQHYLAAPRPSLPVPRHLRLRLVPRNLQEVRRPLALEVVPPAIIQRQALVGRVLIRGLLVRERVRPLLLAEILLGIAISLHRVVVEGHHARGRARGLQRRGHRRGDLRLLQLHLQLLVLHLRLLAHHGREGGVVEHDLDLGDLRLQLGDALGEDLRHVDLPAGLLVRIVLLVEGGVI